MSHTVWSTMAVAVPVARSKLIAGRVAGGTIHLLFSRKRYFAISDGAASAGAAGASAAAQKIDAATAVRR